MKQVFYEFVRRISIELKKAIGMENAEGAAQHLDDEKIQRLQHIIEHVLERIPHKTTTAEADLIGMRFKSLPNEILRQIMNMLKFSIFPGNRTLFDQRLGDVFKFLDRLLASELFNFEELSLFLLAVRAHAMAIRSSQYSFGRSSLLRSPPRTKNQASRWSSRNVTTEPSVSPVSMPRASLSRGRHAARRVTAPPLPAPRVPPLNLPVRRHTSGMLPGPSEALTAHPMLRTSTSVPKRTPRHMTPPPMQRSENSDETDKFIRPQLRIHIPLLSELNEESDEELEEKCPPSTRMPVPVSLIGKEVIPNFLLVIPVTRPNDDDADVNKVEVLEKTPSLQKLLDSMQCAERDAEVESIVLGDPLPDSRKGAERGAEMDSIVLGEPLLDSRKGAERGAEVGSIVLEEPCAKNNTNNDTLIMKVANISVFYPGMLAAS
eukprot:GEMP01017878.1.p1 GENE.GEMP01017878.1~~GEMP01017878.1.p1  ORF type:complete len:457 (+),score=97.78 GEMP01017878.1:74-1372(+)